VLRDVIMDNSRHHHAVTDTPSLMSACRAMTALGALVVMSAPHRRRWSGAVTQTTVHACAGEAFVIWSSANRTDVEQLRFFSQTIASLIPLAMQFSRANLGVRCKLEVCVVLRFARKARISLSLTLSPYCIDCAVGSPCRGHV
jgi:hypothetical protein